MANLKGKLYEHLKERGLIYQTTDEEKVKQMMNGDPICVYSGYDPTADSLHIGHCFSLFMLRKFQDAGHKVVVLLGGATAKIGDPSGRNDMRNMVTSEFINNNYEHIKSTIGNFVKLDGDNPAIIVNNANWMDGYNYIDFMRDIGTHFNVKHMLQNDSCITRLNAGGLTFFEMGYMLIQAYDFVYLNRNYGCTLQIGGSDQWGNIIAGVELGRKLNFQDNKNETFEALVTPLLTNSAGKKMGKTSKGTLWVNKEKTPVYDFYQYFVNQKDEDVEMLFKYLTNLEIDEINKIMAGDIREAKKRMALEITALVHGREEAEKAQVASNALFSQGENYDNAPTYNLEQNTMNVVDVLTKSKLTVSTSEARRLIEQGAISLDNEKIISKDFIVSKDNFKDGFAILKKGKKSVIKLI
ncbi:MAG: tyrosine--tRNA ligase [Clostridia bacterium]|nr:tyrosine--tRNA ligase [Clostridia bacterium]